ncbi:cysteine hydrolase family protein [Roseomonas marmotae]|uniref:Cysteine hydrolase n=1 Tax=Roseomonas marmotae TaxID=2768161 RepID=A0ABS3K798_9PROT|nr:cysteine hydrolase [Roseomonas marmotae]MBO1073336.1 cysteine hydrolase [Roseomonas marmotae]QTI79049.1 cysteine hydrolase [Roseomonas marmotae]
MAHTRDWLMVIDHQPAFSHPDSPWFTPSFPEISGRIARLVPLFGERVLFTRFVPPTRLSGSWSRYYEKWPFARQPSSDWLWAVDAPWQDRASFASHTFSKWLPEAYERFGPEPGVVLCGVSTDCCVLATALAAVDGGAQVRLVEDACAAKSPDVHDNALAIMAARAPQLTVVTTDEECARATGEGAPA